MNLSAHVAVGAAVGYLSKDPILGFVFGLISHHMIDCVPHSDGGSLKVNVKNFATDRRILTIVATDFVIMFAVIWFAYSNHQFYLPMMLGAIGGAVPDLIDNVPFWSPTLRKIYPFNHYHNFHELFHYTIRNQNYIIAGILTQAILILAALRFLLY